MKPDLVSVTERDRGAASAILMQECTMSAQRALWGGADESVLVQEIAKHGIAERERALVEAITFLTKAAHEIAWQAGVGGRETAGAIVSYLATAPDEVAPFFADKLSPIDFAGDWMRGGCLSWHGADGKVWTPEAAAAAKAAIREQDHAE